MCASGIEPDPGSTSITPIPRAATAALTLNSTALQMVGYLIRGLGRLTAIIYTPRASPVTDLLSATTPRSRILITRFASGALQDVTLVQTGSR